MRRIVLALSLVGLFLIGGGGLTSANECCGYGQGNHPNDPSSGKQTCETATSHAVEFHGAQAQNGSDNCPD